MFLIDSYLELVNKDPNSNDERDTIFNRIEGQIVVKYYKPHANTLIVHVKIPSESVSYIKYDVVFQFALPGTISNDTNITSLPCRIFSNCPSFSYKYANIFYNKNMIIKWLRKKYDRIVLKKEPTITNPNNTIGYEKSIYMACRYLSTRSRGRFGVINVLANTKINTLNLPRFIASQSAIDSIHRNSHSSMARVEAPKKDKVRIQPKENKSVVSKVKKTNVIRSTTRKTPKTPKTKKTK